MRVLSIRSNGHNRGLQIGYRKESGLVFRDWEGNNGLDDLEKGAEMHERRL